MTKSSMQEWLRAQEWDLFREVLKQKRDQAVRALMTCPGNLEDLLQARAKVYAFESILSESFEVELKEAANKVSQKDMEDEFE